MKPLIFIIFLIVSIKINAQIVNIPDTNFLNALINYGVDINNDSLISNSEAENITYLNISTKNINDLTGIEAFTNLTKLDCSYNNLININISNNILLVELYCQSNKLTSLNLDNNFLLETLICFFNQLTDINLSNNAKLQMLSLGCYGCTNPSPTNYFDSLNISNNTKLEIIDLAKIPTLTEVCVWELPFPTDSVEDLFINNSPNINFTTNCISNVEEPNKKNINIYPNPSKDYVFIENIDYNKVQLLNLQGVIIKEFTKDEKINFTNLMRGEYIIKIYKNEDCITKKIIIN